ncbi:MAG TPA: hypothetical protein VIV12_20320 [Streptosporangiaceae bacterium]
MIFLGIGFALPHRVGPYVGLLPDACRRALADAGLPGWLARLCCARAVICVRPRAWHGLTDA